MAGERNIILSNCFRFDLSSSPVVSWFGRYYVQPTIFGGHNKMRIFQEEIFGPVMCVTTFKSTAEAIAIANDTVYGLGAGVFTRDAHELFQVCTCTLTISLWT